MKNTVWTTGCSSWYQTPDGEVFLWPGATVDYWWRTRSVTLDDYVVTRVRAHQQTRVDAHASYV
jgi:hypothetical protein